MRMFLAIVIAGGFIIGAEENAGEKRKGLSQDDAIRQRLAENRQDLRQRREAARKAMLDRYDLDGNGSIDEKEREKARAGCLEKAKT